MTVNSVRHMHACSPNRPTPNAWEWGNQRLAMSMYQTLDRQAQRRGLCATRSGPRFCTVPTPRPLSPHPSSIRQVSIRDTRRVLGEHTGFGPGGLGPPACRATMIWSTERTVRAASVASLMAQFLVMSRSRMPSSLASSVPVLSSFCRTYVNVGFSTLETVWLTSMSTPYVHSSFLCAAA